jgi:formiminoglutamase
LKPTTITAPDTAAEDPRVGHLLGKSATAEDAAVVLVGFPSDEGIVINGGRAGAAEAPDQIRRWLYRLTPDARASDRFTGLLARTVDLGDLEIHGPLEQDQEALGELLTEFVKRGVIPITFGGGHETAFGHFLAYVYSGRSVSILNWDGHPDVRPLKNGRAHSGSPFQQALKHLSGSCAGYTVAGLLPYQVAATHLEFIRENEGEFIWRDQVTEAVIRDVYSGMQTPSMVSFDLDAVDHVHAPGVSAPGVGGMPIHLWLRAAYEAGKCRAVTSMDIVELNPRVDLDGRTARLAALTVWSFLKGLSERIDTDAGL